MLPINIQTTDTNGLYSIRKSLIRIEPQGHSLLDCWTPDCPQCAEYRAWAEQLREVNRELNARQSK